MASQIFDISLNSLLFGIPKIEACSSNYKPSDSPGNSGVFVINSNSIHPAAHTSILIVYLFEPKISSGAL
jgi:hypothetical protein